MRKHRTIRKFNRPVGRTIKRKTPAGTTLKRAASSIVKAVSGVGRPSRTGRRARPGAGATRRAQRNRRYRTPSNGIGVGF